MRFAACIEYDGSGFSGWQIQKHAVRTIQGEVERALSKVANHPVSIITAGRTDAQVHATHQVIHFDSESPRDLQAWVRGSNRFLDKDVRLLWVREVDDEFHARFSALSRSYRFVIYNNRVNTAILRKSATHVYYDLHIEKMKTAAECLLGEHDFSAFRASGCQAHSPVRRVEHLSLDRSGSWLWFDIKANAFLQHMVRNIAGCLIAVGSGKKPVDWMGHVLHSRDRTKGGVTATPNGLYLCGVDYSESFNLPSSYRHLSYWA